VQSIVSRNWRFALFKQRFNIVLFKSLLGVARDINDIGAKQSLIRLTAW